MDEKRGEPMSTEKNLTDQEIIDRLSSGTEEVPEGDISRLLYDTTGALLGIKGGEWNPENAPVFDTRGVVSTKTLEAYFHLVLIEGYLESEIEKEKQKKG